MTSPDPIVAAPMGGDGTHDRLRAVLDEMAAAGEKITFTTAARRAGLTRQALFRHPTMRAMVNEFLGPDPARRAPRRSSPVVPHVPAPPVPADPARDLRRLADEWVDDRLRRGQIGLASAVLYQSRVETFLAVYQDCSQLNRVAMLEWQRSLSHLSQSSRRAYVGAVSRFVRWLLAEGHVSMDLAAHLDQVREPRSVPRALAALEVTQLIEACQHRAGSSRDGISAGARRSALLRDQVIIWLMVSCGLRCLEVSRLDLADYDPDAATIFVRGKGGHERVLPVPVPAQKAIDAYLTVRGYQAGPLVVGVGSKTARDGRLSPKAVSKRMGEIMTAAGVHRAGDGKSAHALRHTAASDVLDRCLDLRVVQQMLGHASLATTERYLRRADLGRLRQAMEGRSYARMDGRQP